ncbi:calcium-binding protein [Paracoccus aestuariivivens]|uniref:Glycoside hydrolase family 5 domain-containing protein n=1 Tax=Paracoccus aestuariivivens TaxID=1820333 RepID=A0A6L6JCY9_9RHOB|nr:calcium-binding protein [Paracoccus aestuariivivens]MTH79028.1 hypothetical protein [Paracoccus aestuariivivens]
MVCSDLAFASEMAGWNTVSFATEYASVVNDPDQITTLDGHRLPSTTRGFVVQKLSNRADSLSEADRSNLPNRQRAKELAVVSDPLTGNLARDASGRLLMIELPDKSTPRAGLNKMVSWRSGAGLSIAHGGTTTDILDALSGSFPEVNVLRLDFNAATARSPEAARSWADFARAAAARGYRLIVQNSDGELAGGFVSGQNPKLRILPASELGPADALEQPDGSWKINRVREDWRIMLDWFRLPENTAILDAIAGWELINEPIAYGKGPRAGKIYSQHIADLIGSLDWQGKRLLVGGLGASAQFGDLDQALIRQAAGDALIWSVHMYPQWVAAAFPDSQRRIFDKQICARIGMLREPGDDILITESQLYTASGSLSPSGKTKRSLSSFNMARVLPWFADQGIGWTWWPPTGRGSDLLQWQGARDGYSVELESAAFAHWGWSRKLDQTPSAEAWGTDGNDALAVSPSASPDQDRLTNNVGNPHGLVFGMQGNDSIAGHAGPDLLYGGPDNDSIQGQDGDDWLFGDRGDDSLDGGAGNDVLIDPEGRNSISGGAGNDHLEGMGSLDGGVGADTLIAAVGGATTLSGGAGPDRFLPNTSGEVTITDFAQGEDRFDWSMMGRTFRCKLDVRIEGNDAILGWLDLSVRLTGVETPDQAVLDLGGNCPPIRF